MHNSAGLQSKGTSDIKFVLDGALLGAIFCGQISRWNDARILRLNTNIQQLLPDKPIMVVVREATSGSSAIFSAALAEMSPAFGAMCGSGDQVQWKAPLRYEANSTSGLVAAVNALEYRCDTYCVPET